MISLTNNMMFSLPRTLRELVSRKVRYLFIFEVLYNHLKVVFGEIFTLNDYGTTLKAILII